MKKAFWLLDVNYEVKDHRPEVWIWGIDEEGKRTLIIDRNFHAYFYLLTKKRENPQAVMERIKACKEDFPFLVRLEPLDRRFFGRPRAREKACMHMF